MSNASIRHCWSPARGIVVNCCASLNLLLSKWELDTLQNKLVHYFFSLRMIYDDLLVFSLAWNLQELAKHNGIDRPSSKTQLTYANARIRVYSWFSIVQIAHCLVIYKLQLPVHQHGNGGSWWFKILPINLESQRIPCVSEVWDPRRFPKAPSLRHLLGLLRSFGWKQAGTHSHQSQMRLGAMQTVRVTWNNSKLRF